MRGCARVRQPYPRMTQEWRERNTNMSHAALHRSLWLQEAQQGETDELPLEGAQRADIAIIGGGYVGLWTALRIAD